ncbi:MAG: hypothetical protein JWR11_6247 [Mycobacterium sp.]|nr:hypothetical protein [Mycobacterium sp.]
MTGTTEADHTASDPRGHWAPSRGVLMSYSYLGSSPQAIDRTHAQNVLRVREDLRTSAGAVMAAPLAIAMLDAGVVNVESLHVRAVTQVDVTVVDCALDVERMLLAGAFTAEARSQLFTEARIVDADDPERRIGFGTANWAIVGTTPQRFCFPEPAAVLPGAGALPPLWHAYSARRRFDGRLEIPRLQDVGAERLHHAPMLIVAEAVALEHAADTLGTDELSVDSLSMSLVAPGRVGPFVATPVFSAVDAETVGCRVELRDTGWDDCLVAAAFIRMQSY